MWQSWCVQRRALAAPTLLHYEVTNVLYRYQRSGMLTPGTVQLAHKAALALPLQLVGEAQLHVRALELAARLRLPAAYDAHYLAAAERLDAELWTGDARLARAVEESLPWVRLLT